MMYAIILMTAQWQVYDNIKFILALQNNEGTQVRFSEITRNVSMKSDTYYIYMIYMNDKIYTYIHTHTSAI